MKMKRKIYVLMILLVCGMTYTACIHHEPRALPEYIPANQQVIGHRGARGLAPENSMAAFAEAARLKVPFELDVQFCATGEAVVFHDYDLKRIAGIDKKVLDVGLAELKTIDIGSHFDKSYRNERIATLGEVLDAYAHKVIIDIEIKTQKTDEEALKIANVVADEVSKRKLEGRVFISSFNPYILERMKLVKPELLRGQIYGEFKNDDLAWTTKVILRNLVLNSKADVDMLVPDFNMVDADYMETMKGHGYNVLVWTVNDTKDVQRMIDVKVDGIITDYPDKVLKMQAAHYPSPQTGDFVFDSVRSWMPF